MGLIFKYTFTLQTITFNPFSTVTYGADDFSLAATTSSGLALKYSSSDETVAKIVNNTTVHILKPGSCTIYAEQPGNATYYPASSSQVLTIISPTSVGQQLSGIRKIYPNPVEDQLRIENGTEPVIKVEIMDVRGSIVISQACKATNVAVNTSGLSRGSYTVKLFNEDGSTSVTKIIKQ